MLQIKSLKKSYGIKTLFDDVNLAIGNGIKAGVVGINGVGKSTLFDIISGKNMEYSGYVSFNIKEPLVGYMHQQISIDNLDCSIYDFVKKYTGIEDIELEINLLIDELSDPEKMNIYSEKYEMFEKLGGYEFDYKSQKLLNELGLGKYDVDISIRQLSGGEKNKLLLCATLLKGGDLLLLDEPTNNLDNSSILGLIGFIKKSSATCLIISHDNEFLNETVNKIYEIENGKINEYTGNFDYYQNEKTLQYNRELLEFERQQEEQKRMETAKRDLLSKAQNIGNRGNTKDNDKGDGSSKVAKKLASQAKSIKTRIDRMEIIEKPKKKKLAEIILNVENLPEGNILVKDLFFKYNKSDDFELNIKSIEIGSKDKVLIMGDNGHGKSTFIKLLTGELTNTSGQLSISPSIKIGYFAQEQNSLPFEKTPIEYIESKGHFSFEEINGALGRLGFDKEDRDKKINQLSPGMRARLIFALITLNKYNCIIFDEPTNHVDIETAKQLESAINSFNGIIIVVSHDKKFIKNIKFNKKIQFENGHAIVN